MLTVLSTYNNLTEDGRRDSRGRKDTRGSTRLYSLLRPVRPTRLSALRPSSADFCKLSVQVGRVLKTVVNKHDCNIYCSLVIQGKKIKNKPGI